MQLVVENVSRNSDYLYAFDYQVWPYRTDIVGVDNEPDPALIICPMLRTRAA